MRRAGAHGASGRPQPTHHAAASTSPAGAQRARHARAPRRPPPPRPGSQPHRPPPKAILSLARLLQPNAPVANPPPHPSAPQAPLRTQPLAPPPRTHPFPFTHTPRLSQPSLTRTPSRHRVRGRPRAEPPAAVWRRARRVRGPAAGAPHAVQGLGQLRTGGWVQGGFWEGEGRVRAGGVLWRAQQRGGLRMLRAPRACRRPAGAAGGRLQRRRRQLRQHPATSPPATLTHAHIRGRTRARMSTRHLPSLRAPTHPPHPPSHTHTHAQMEKRVGRLGDPQRFDVARYILQRGERCQQVGTAALPPACACRTARPSDLPQPGRGLRTNAPPLPPARPPPPPNPGLSVNPGSACLAQAWGLLELQR